jgi:hypothetical protein
MQIVPLSLSPLGGDGRGSITQETLSHVFLLTPLPVGTAFWEMKSLESGLEMQIKLMSTAHV